MDAVRGTYVDGRTSRRRYVTLTIDDGRLMVVGSDVDMTVPLDAVEISEPLGWSPRVVRLPGGGSCEVRDADALTTALARNGRHPGWLARFERQSWLIAASVLAVAGTLVFGYIVGAPRAAAFAATRMPRQTIETISTQTLRTLDRSVLAPSRIPRERRQTLRRAVGALPLPDAVRSQIRIEFRRSAALGPNALALPSGIIVVTDQLVALARDDDELVAVLAHEAAHVHYRHGVRSVLQRSALALAVTWFMGDVSALAATIPTALLDARYSRVFELEADAFAVSALRSGGRSAEPLAAILERMARQQGDRTGPSSYLSTHPSTAERLAALRAGGQ